MTHTIELSKITGAESTSILSIDEIISKATEMSIQCEQDIEDCLQVVLKMINMEIRLSQARQA